MPNITISSNFTDEPIKIPNAVNESAGVNDSGGVDKIITENERILLKEILGDVQYTTLQEELAKTPFNSGAAQAADQNYVDLVNGSGAYQGLVPMLDNFIFCAWLEATEITQTMVSSGKGKTQGFTVADNSSKYVRRWNRFVEEYEAVMDYIATSDFFEYQIPDRYYENKNSLDL